MVYTLLLIPPSLCYNLLNLAVITIKFPPPTLELFIYVILSLWKAVYTFFPPAVNIYTLMRTQFKCEVLRKRFSALCLKYYEFTLSLYLFYQTTSSMTKVTRYAVVIIIFPVIGRIKFFSRSKEQFFCIIVYLAENGYPIHRTTPCHSRLPMDQHSNDLFPKS